MNFLQMCQRVRQEVGVSGDGPQSVDGQLGMYKKIVDWVLSAHEEIQVLRSNWSFDWDSFSIALTDGVETYDPNDVWSLSVREWDFDSFYCYRTAQGPSSRTWLTYVEHPEYRKLAINTTTGIPSYVTQNPAGKLSFYPYPTDGITFYGEHHKLPEVLVNNTSTPRMPARYHMVIVWRAVMLLCASEENPALFTTAERNFNTMMAKMLQSELQDFPYPEPMA